MKKNNKRRIASLLAGGMLMTTLVSAQAAFAQENESADTGVTEITYPLSEETITLEFYSCTNESVTIPFAENKLFTDYEKLTNIHIDFTEIPFASWYEKIQLSMASGDYPDVYAGGMGPIDTNLLQEYAEQGVIIPLNDLIENYTVNIKKYLAENDELRKMCTMADGNIYSIPTIHQNFNRAFWQLSINKTWLDQLGMDYPETMDEFRDYLRAVTTTDMDGNGELDEIGFSVPGASYLNYLMGCFGTLDTGNHLYINDEDEVSFSATSDEYRAFLEYMHDMYAEGLIDPESFTQDSTRLNAKAASSSAIGASIQFLSNSYGETVCEYKIAPVLTNNEGVGEWPRNGRINDVYLNGFSITCANENPIETIQWLDYWMDNGEHALTMRYGTRGEYWDYTGEEGGEWEVFDVNPVTGETIDAFVRGKVCTQALVIPLWMFSDTNDKLVVTNEYSIEKRDSQEWYDPYLSNPYPTVYMTSEDSTEISGLAMELNNYIGSQEALFIMEGVTDEAWEDYVERCEKLGSERYLEIYTKYYEDYLTK